MEPEKFSVSQDLDDTLRPFHWSEDTRSRGIKNCMKPKNIETVDSWSHKSPI